jgi:hypothetical protein
MTILALPAPCCALAAFAATLASGIDFRATEETNAKDPPADLPRAARGSARRGGG